MFDTSSLTGVFQHGVLFLFICAMSAPWVLQALKRPVQKIGRSRSRPFAVNIKRSASTKHPSGFTPPTAEDLTELRERVQDFARELPLNI